MNHIVCCVALLAFSTNALSDVRPEYSGAWYNPNQSGHGFSIDVISEERSVAFWYAYDSAGDPIFLLADGVNVGNSIEAQVYYYEGMVWGEFDPSTNERIYWGTLTITFEGCDTANLEYDSKFVDKHHQPFGSGQMSLVHLAEISGLRCLDTRLTGIYEGTLFSSLYIKLFRGVAVVDESHNLNFISPDGYAMKGQLTVDDASTGGFEANKGVAVFYQKWPWFSYGIDIRGIFETDILDGHYIPVSIAIWEDMGEFDFIKLHRSTYTPVRLADIAGSYEATNLDLNFKEPVTIKLDGTFTLVDQYEGCLLEGRVSIPNPDLSILRVTTTVSQCAYAEINGTYIGSGFYLRGDITFSGWNDEDRVLPMKLVRDEEVSSGQ